MPEGKTESRVLGSVLGLALGDAAGAPFEFAPVESVAARLGGPWIDDLYTFEGQPGAHGVWRSPAPAGTGTDDTRYSWLFLELASGLERMPAARELARRLLWVYGRPGDVFPTAPELAQGQFELWEPASRGLLGQESSLCPGVPPDVLRDRSLGLNYPTLIGLIVLTAAGLLFPGRPAEAYRAAFRTDFLDVGYGREAVGVLAAAVSLAVAGECEPDAAIRQAAEVDPFCLGGPFGGPFVREHLGPFLDALPLQADDRELAENLSRRLAAYRPFDPFKTIAIAFSAVLSRPTDPWAAILMAANTRGVDADGDLGSYQDIDCYACVTGALAGAIAGAGAFPPHLLDAVVESNREVYGIDLRATTERLARWIR
jgi:hypothetical protein